MRAKPKRGKLRSMKNTDSFRDYVIDQLAGVRGLRPRAMFGGIGLYAGDVFFGILAADVLYFKTDDSNRGDYETAGMEPFKPYPDRPMTMPYYQVPIDALEDSATLAEWAKRAIVVATRYDRAPRLRKRA